MKRPEPVDFTISYQLLNFTWNVNVHWYNSVTATDDSVRVVVVSSTVSAAGEKNHGGHNYL